MYINEETRIIWLNDIKRWNPTYNAERFDKMPDDRFTAAYQNIKKTREKLLSKLKKISATDPDFRYNFHDEIYRLPNKSLEKIIEIHTKPNQGNKQELASEKEALYKLLIFHEEPAITDVEKERDNDYDLEFLTDQEFYDMTGESKEEYSEAEMARMGFKLELDSKINYKTIEYENQKKEELKTEIIEYIFNLKKYLPDLKIYSHKQLAKYSLDSLIEIYLTLKEIVPGLPEVDNILTQKRP